MLPDGVGSEATTTTYDAAGNLASITSSNANGASMSYTYDNLNRVSSVTDKLGTTNYTYDDASNLYTATNPNSVQAQYSYDPLNRISGLTAQQSGYVYQRGPTGNMTSASELNGRSMTWSFDGIYRLTSEAITGDPVAQNNGSVGYDLDPVGNRTSDTSSLTGITSGRWNYNADDELSGETYDQDGNVTATNGKTFAYNSQNELVTMNGGAVQMLYDGDGNRVAKAATSGGVTTTTQYLVDDLNPTGLPQVMDELTNGVVTRTYSYGLQRIDEDQIVSGAWTPSFYNYDGGGNVIDLTSSTGNVTDRYEYDAFGNRFTVSGSTPNNYLYRGEQWDPDLGLYYLRARYYNPLSGRFLSRDPFPETWGQTERSRSPPTSSGGGFCLEFDSQSFHYGECCFQGWIAFGAERPVKLLTRQARLPGNFSHSFGPRHHAKGVGNVTGVIGLKRLRHENRDGAGRSQILRRIIFAQFSRHLHFSIPPPIALPSRCLPLVFFYRRRTTE